MSVRRLTVLDRAALDAALASLGAEAPKVAVYVLFSGAKSAETGASWCPDCVAAEPVLDRALAAGGSATALVYVPLERAEYRGNEAHWARMHPTFRLERIPTIFKMGATAQRSISQLVEAQCLDESLAADFVE